MPTSYILIVGWNGGFGEFTIIYHGSGTQYGVKTGDVWSASTVRNHSVHQWCAESPGYGQRLCKRQLGGQCISRVHPPAAVAIAIFAFQATRQQITELARTPDITGT